MKIKANAEIIFLIKSHHANTRNNTIIPNIILYIPKETKSLFFMYCINHLITRYATTKETTDPTPNNCHSIGENLSPFFISFSNVAPNIVGIARKKENSVATPLESPKSKLSS